MQLAKWYLLSSSQRWSILAVRVLDNDFPIAEGEQVTAIHFNARSISARTLKRPFRDTTISGYEVAGSLPLSIREGCEHFCERGTNLLLPCVPHPTDIRPSRGFKDTVVSHTGHQCIKVVPIPSLCKHVQQVQILFIAHVSHAQVPPRPDCKSGARSGGHLANNCPAKPL
jgi:hypothetical protein